MLSFKICYISHISRWHSSVYSSLDLPYDAVVMQGRLTYLHPCQSHPFCHFCFIFGRYDYIIISCVYGCAYVCVCVLKDCIWVSYLFMSWRWSSVRVCTYLRLPVAKCLTCLLYQIATVLKSVSVWMKAKCTCSFPDTLVKTSSRSSVCLLWFCVLLVCVLVCVCVCMTTAVGQLSFHGGRDTFDLIWLHQRAKNIHTTFLSDS